MADSHELESHGRGLNRALGVWDLVSFGIAAIIGAGIFSTVGSASFSGGPAVVILFIITAVTCGFSALCYAEFAASVPVSGSAYTYAYATFGELFAWIIGWDLIVEYTVGNIAVAISWSDYFTGLLGSYGLDIPRYFSMDFVSASRAFDAVQEALRATGAAVSGTVDAAALAALESAGSITGAQIEGYRAWMDAPRVFGLPVVCDLPALGIVVFTTSLIYIGIQESKRVANAMVLLKVGVVLLVVTLGAFYVQPSNWSPFMPNGMSGVMQGVAAVFFAYIGFDAISTTAEECRDPQRDLPRGILYSLLICTVLYILIALVLTGMVNYKDLNVGDPLAFVFGPEGANIPWISSVIAVSAVVALTTVILVFQLGQPRIWMAMSRDGLLPSIFSSIHPRFRTPWFSSLVTGLFVGIPSLFMNLSEVTNLTSIGTLFAFTLVCGGVLMLDKKRPSEGRFRIPYINAKWIAPGLALAVLAALLIWNADGVQGFFSLTNPEAPGESGWLVFRHKIPTIIYVTVMGWVVVQCFRKELSLIPVLGLASSGYLMTELGFINWMRFGIWLAVGIVIYFLYGRRHSRLAALQR